MTRERCEQCGFDSDLYNRADTISSQRILPAVLAVAVEGLPAELLARRPDDHTWSIAEYIDHVREVTFANRFAIDLLRGDPGIDLGAAPRAPFSAEPKQVDFDVALRGVAAEFEAMGETLASLDDAQWSAPATLDGKQFSVDWFARHVLHDTTHHLGDIGRIVHGFGAGAVMHQGSVTQINVSGGGVPKKPVEHVAITGSGLEGDGQADRRNHGRPLQAICLWSADVIAALASEGHPIAAGSAGENLTLSGIDWASVRPGSRIDVGNVAMLITAHAIPCSKNAQWFSDRDFNRILHGEHPGFSRLYAVPLAPGTVRVGDVVTVEPLQT